MQTPTPPTKPTPPTPPTMNMKPSSNNRELPPPPISNSTSTPKSQTIETPKEFKTTNTPLSTPQPSLGSYQEVSSQNTPVPITPASKKPSPLGFGFIFSLVLLFTITLVCFRLWKKSHKTPQGPRTILDYSTDASKELLDLMNSSTTITPSPNQVIVQGKGNTSSKVKGNFEVRI